MRLTGTAAFPDVLRAYRRDHPVDRPHAANTNRDGGKALDTAEETLGTWTRVLLTREEVLGVVLPWHLSEGGARELVPRSGLTVGRAAELVRSAGAEFAGANPVCSGKLDLFRHAPRTPVYLSTRPLPHPDYAGLRVRSGLFHLDGLHRMIAWELAGRLPHGDGTEAFVAGVPLTTPPRPPGAPRPDAARTGGPRP